MIVDQALSVLADLPAYRAGIPFATQVGPRWATLAPHIAIIVEHPVADGIDDR